MTTKDFIGALKVESQVMNSIQCLLYGPKVNSNFADLGHEFLIKQITSFNVLKAAVIRCAAEQSGGKMINVRILLDIVNSILAMHRI